jgi:glycosyltransferase involved in cell wall biosynthesis
LEEKVKFFGVRSDVPELLSQADIFVLSSDYEGFGLVVAEAMAAGLPVIATAIGGIPEILEGGRAGILVPPKDVDALAKAIVELARDEKKRAELSDYGRKLVAERFDIRRTVREYEKLYLELLEKKKGSKKFRIKGNVL